VSAWAKVRCNCVTRPATDVYGNVHEIHTGTWHALSPTTGRALCDQTLTIDRGTRRRGPDTYAHVCLACLKRIGAKK
jgi:hypothetical protein